MLEIENNNAVKPAFQSRNQPCRERGVRAVLLDVVVAVLDAVELDHVDVREPFLPHVVRY